MQGEATIRRARAAEAELLSALALRSKALWGYDDRFIEQCRAALRVTVDHIETAPFYVIESRGEVTGFYGLAIAPPLADLAFLFVEPAQVRRGLGRRLVEHALATARGLGCRELRILADPFAEAFYAEIGAVRIGDAPSDAIPGRTLPLMRLSRLKTTARKQSLLPPPD
jgi:N-acetylglutamate synthase-like GNAT family acetyltransferase